MLKYKKEPKKRIKIKKKPVIIAFLVIIFLSASIYCVFQIPMRQIIITGNSILTDHDIISKINIKNYPKLYQLNLRNIKKILKNEMSISEVNISRTFTGKLTINIEENKVLFYNRYTNKIVFNSKEEASVDTIKSGIPVLINYVPNSEYQRLIEELAKINDDTLALISEIEFYPWKNEETIIDNTRFLLRMNDGNHVHINLINMEKLNNYITFFATLPDNTKGTWYLDSSFGSGYFKPFGE